MVRKVAHVLLGQGGADNLAATRTWRPSDTNARARRPGSVASAGVSRPPSSGLQLRREKRWN